MNATTVGRSNSEINSSTYTEVMADLPNVSIGPRGEMAMSKTFKVNVGDMNSFIAQNPDFSPVKFSITICYSFDNGETPCVINSDFFINSFMNEIVVERQTNAAIRSILTKKPNASLEPWYMLKSYRGYRNVENVQNQSIFYNYQ